MSTSLTPREKVVYLTNLVVVARADDKLTPEERAVLQRCADAIDADSGQLQAALSILGLPDVNFDELLRFSTQVRNLEDMIELAICDGEMDRDERDTLLQMALAIGVSQDMVNRMLGEAQRRLNAWHALD